MAPPASPATAPVTAILVYDLSATGVVRNAIALANRLAHEGRPVQLVTCRAEGALATTLDPAVALVDLGVRGGSRAIVLLRSLGRLRRHLRATAPALVLSAGNHFHLACHVATRNLMGARVAYRISNSLSHGGEGDRKSGRMRLLRQIAKRADRLFLVSRSLADDAAAVGATIIENGVDIRRVRAEAAKPPAFVLDGQAAQVLAVGRLCAQKNYETLIRAVAHASITRPLQLTILGGGPSSYRAKLAALAERLGIASRVTFRDPVSNPYAIMAQADAVVVPSRWEGASNVLLEALACGKPVVAAARAGNAAEVLAGGLYGRLIAEDDWKGMGGAILDQLGPDAVLPGERAGDYALDRVMDRYLAAFDEMLAATPVRSRSAIGTSVGWRRRLAVASILGLFGTTASAEPDALISVAKAVAHVEHQLSARAIDVELETSGARLVYEIELVRGDTLHEVLVDARTGRMVSANRPRALGLYRRWFDGDRMKAGTRIMPLGTLLNTIEQDKGHRVHEATLKMEGGRPVYEVEIGVDLGAVDAVYDAVSGRRIGVGRDDD
jgi:glycosyltransferase involved in cell wall biosynthesis/uncharacterized membrane protein YkoI